MLEEESKVPVIIDTGIGLSSQALKAIEMGADVVVNTAIAVADNPVIMANVSALL